MSINLGLGRVQRLLEVIGNPHQKIKIIHIAGTNGKGSVCSYLSSVLQSDLLPETNPKVGKFTTPHMIHITDSISVNNKPISSKLYESIRRDLEEKDRVYKIDCTEFELLTCTAIKFFQDSSCNICVFEVGLGGRLDATNIVPGGNKLACGITKIGLDHESILGSTLREIAREKAGIITKEVKFVVVDGSNDKDVLDEISIQCNEVGCELYITDPNPDKDTYATDSWNNVILNQLPLNGDYQAYNISIAIKILDKLQSLGKIKLNNEVVTKGLGDVKWPGRLQELEFCLANDRSQDEKHAIPVLLDGAHNGSAAIELSKYIKNTYGEDQSINFIIAVTAGKKLEPLLSPLIRNQDNVIVTEFKSVDGMPWIKPYDSNDLAKFIKENYTERVSSVKTLSQAVSQLEILNKDKDTPIIICGSLYLCGQFLNIHHQNSQD